MAYSAISKPSLYFNTKLYTGNGSTQSITGVGHQPDWVWIKRRDSSGSHIITDAVRGTGKIISSNSGGAEFDEGSNGVSAFGTDGFSIGNLSSINTNSGTFASWNWKAGGGQGSSNTDGSINTTYTSVNTTAGFSIVSYTGTGSAGTLGHGLSAVPKMIILKERGGTENWMVYHASNTSAPETDYLLLNSAAATADANTVWNDTAPTSSVFSIGTDSSVNTSGDTYIAYCFAEKKGYSKFGSYVGNGNTNGTFIYTGFKPAWVMVKRTDSTNNWMMIDNKRTPSNTGTVPELFADSNSAENNSTDGRFDYLSNGLKARGTNAVINASNATYIYMAYADEPLVANVGQSIPATAR